MAKSSRGQPIYSTNNQKVNNMGEAKSQWANLLPNAAGAAAGGIMGMIFGKYNDQRQLAQQEKLQQLQMQGMKEMTNFEYDKQLQMWKDTSYGAQKEQMKMAGINPALMYGMGGGGGQSIGSAAGTGVTGGNAPVGGREVQDMMGMGMQMQMMRAQTAVMESQANKNNVEAEKIQGVDTAEASERIGQIMQNTKNLAAQEAATKIETSLKTIELSYKEGNEAYRNEILEKERDIIENQLSIIQNQKDISNDTKESAIQKIKTEATNAVLHGEAIKAGINVSMSQIQKISVDILQGWKDLDIKEKSQKIQEKFLQENIDYMPIDRAIKGIDIITNLIPRKGGSNDGILNREKFDKDGNMSYERTFRTKH